MRLIELKVEWSEVSNGSAKQALAKEVLDVLKPHRDNLKNLEIKSYGGAEFPKWVVDPSFIRLTDVLIHNCRNCVFLPPLGQLPSLKKLYITGMGDVKEVGSEFLGTGPAFPSLEILKFYNMPRWEVWSVNAVDVAVFPCIKKLEISNCPNIARWEVWSANANVGVFPCLENLQINQCRKLVKVSLEALPSLRDLGIEYCSDVLLKSVVCVASSLTKLSIQGISGLSDEAWGGIVQYLGTVEGLKIRMCNEIRNLWESEEEEDAGACEEVLVNLKKLDISDCEKLVRIGEEKKEGSNLPTSLRMLRIWQCENLKHLSCPDNIETLKIQVCNNLEHLSFPANYNSIQELFMYSCRSITSVSFPTGGRGGGGWQKLKSLDVWRCNSVLEKEMEKQVLLNDTNMPMMLEAVGIIDGWKDLKSITKFTTCFIQQQLTKLVIESCEGIESFPDLQDLTSLKQLRIENCMNMDGPPPMPLRRRSGGGGVSGGVWPPKLESLSIGRLKRPISEWGPLPNSLVILTLLGGFGSSSSSSEEGDVKSFPTSSLLPYSSSLTSLGLLYFENMESISSSSSSEGLQHLTSLQHLSISDCPRLKHLPETLLPSLLSLVIYTCRNEELKEKMTTRRSGSYWPLLSHIPKVVFD